jgi:hypothetical protein
MKHERMKGLGGRGWAARPFLYARESGDEVGGRRIVQERDALLNHIKLKMTR